jgi:hypothetical protein
MKTIAVIDKTTIYDDEKKLGYPLRKYTCLSLKKLSEYNSLLQSEFVPESIYPLFYTFFHF